MDIDIRDYLKEEEIKDMFIEEVKKVGAHYIREKFRTTEELNTVLNNQAYLILWQMVDDVFNNNLEEMLTQKISKLISEMGRYNIFREPTEYDNTSNKAYDFLEKTITSQYPIVKKIVESNIEPQVLSALKDNIEDLIKDAIQEIYIRKC